MIFLSIITPLYSFVYMTSAQTLRGVVWKTGIHFFRIMLQRIFGSD